MNDDKKKAQEFIDEHDVDVDFMYGLKDVINDYLRHKTFSFLDFCLAMGYANFIVLGNIMYCRESQQAQGGIATFMSIMTEAISPLRDKYKMN